MTMPTCPSCRTNKVQPAPRRSFTDRLLGFFLFTPFRCQLCGHSFHRIMRQRTAATRRNYQRIPVRYPVWFQTTLPARSRETFQGTVENLSIRGCRVRSATSFPIGTRLQLEFLPSPHTFPITIDGAIVRSRRDDVVGLRFVALLREEERRISHIVNLKLPSPSS
ncbi:MAG: PilZ domain-containing protein [Nitrospiraceae bacterium]|nr:PilZ domain-containing protein [Nitrospiraceae bacterium]